MSADSNINIRVTSSADTKGIDEANKALDNLQQTAADSGVIGMDASPEAVASIENAATAMKRVRTATDEVAATAKDATRQIRGMADAAGKVQDATDAVSTAATDAGGSLDVVIDKVSNLQDTVRHTGDEATSTVEGVDKSFEDLGDTVHNTGGVINAISAESIQYLQAHPPLLARIQRGWLSVKSAAQGLKTIVNKIGISMAIANQAVEMVAKIWAITFGAVSEADRKRRDQTKHLIEAQIKLNDKVREESKLRNTEGNLSTLQSAWKQEAAAREKQIDALRKKLDWISKINEAEAQGTQSKAAMDRARLDGQLARGEISERAHRDKALELEQQSRQELRDIEAKTAEAHVATLREAQAKLTTAWSATQQETARWHRLAGDVMTQAEYDQIKGHIKTTKIARSKAELDGDDAMVAHYDRVLDGLYNTTIKHDRALRQVGIDSTVEGAVALWEKLYQDQQDRLSAAGKALDAVEADIRTARDAQTDTAARHKREQAQDETEYAETTKTNRHADIRTLADKRYTGDAAALGKQAEEAQTQADKASRAAVELGEKLQKREEKIEKSYIDAAKRMDQQQRGKRKDAGWQPSQKHTAIWEETKKYMQGGLDSNQAAAAKQWLQQLKKQQERLAEKGKQDPWITEMIGIMKDVLKREEELKTNKDATRKAEELGRQSDSIAKMPELQQHIREDKTASNDMAEIAKGVISAKLKGVSDQATVAAGRMFVEALADGKVDRSEAKILQPVIDQLSKSQSAEAQAMGALLREILSALQAQEAEATQNINKYKSMKSEVDAIRQQQANRNKAGL